MKLVHLIFIYSLIMFLSSCTTPKSKDFFPLKDGTKWEYTMQYLLPNGTVQTGKYISRIDGIEQINGVSYFKIVEVVSGIPGAESNVTYARKSKEGVFNISAKYKEKPEYLVYKFPIEVGASWTSVFPQGELNYNVESIETLELIDRSIEGCFKLSYTGTIENSKISGYLFLAEKFGKVKEVSEVNGITIDFILDKYE